MKRVLFVCCLFCLFPVVLMGQTRLEGIVSDVNGEPLANINILVYPRGSTAIIAFAVSDNQGRFQIVVRSASDSLDVEASAVHYRNLRMGVYNKPQELVFELEPEIVELDAFTIKAEPIEQRGDTLSYLVSSFASEEDRAIVDVLRRMPGIEVESGGRILYHGEPIQRFYVEGLDLMGGRYGLISNNMPHRSVAAVEILENHQPLRILEERVLSHRASLNIKLKRDITTTGRAQLGSGFEPWVRDVNFTPMVFFRDFQLAASYQTNNAGRDLSRETNRLTTQDFVVLQTESSRGTPGLLSIQEMGAPGFSERRYLDNNGHLGNVNALLKLGRDFQLRTNLFYMYDVRRQQGAVARTLYLPGDSLVIAETLENRINDNSLQGEMTLTRNVRENFFENSLKFQTHWDGSRGLLNLGDNPVQQSLASPFRALSNDLRTLHPIGNYLVEFQSQVSWDHSPQRLTVSPGLFEHLLNDGIAYGQTHQKLDMRRLYANHSAGFSFQKNDWTITPLIGFAYRKLGLKSDVFTGTEESMAPVSGVFSNDLNGHSSRAYLQTNIQYRASPNLTFTANVPINWQQVIMEDVSLGQEQQTRRLTLEPRLGFNYQISGFWRTSASYRLSRNLGSMEGTHYGFILVNHRSMRQNAVPIQETKGQHLSMMLRYRNPLTGFFHSFFYMYSKNQYSLLYGNQIMPGGSIVREAFEQPNTGSSHTLQGNLSKQISVLSTVLTLNAAFTRQNRLSLVNGDMFQGRSEMANIRPEVNVRFAEWMRTEYRASLIRYQTRLHGDRSSRISMARHYFDMSFYPSATHYIKVSNEFYRHADSDYFFLDLMYRFTLRKYNLDMEVNWINIFRTETYTTYQTSAFSVAESVYFLRPPQLLFSVRFNF